jgi:hypothetical protein
LASWKHDVHSIAMICILSLHVLLFHPCWVVCLQILWIFRSLL